MLTWYLLYTQREKFDLFGSVNGLTEEFIIVNITILMNQSDSTVI